MRLIDADALKKDIARLHILNDEAEIRRAYASNPYSTLSDFEDTLVSVFDDIDEAPTIDAYRPNGEWIYCEDYVGHDGYKCSECGFFVPWCYDVYADSNFIRHYHTCPHCDSRMRGADDE